MKRRLVAAGLVLLFPLGMAACGSQSKADACKEINNARDKALEQVDALSVFSGSEDFKNKLDTFLAIHKEAAKKVTNDDVKAAYADFYESDEVLDLTTELSAHGEKLNELCGFSWDR